MRIEDTFNIRRSDGSLVKMRVPEPQKKMIRDGILGKSRGLVGTGISYIGVTNKGRQLGFSAILAAESVLIAEDYPHTEIYYVATARDQALDWTKKLNQLIVDSNSWPEELGGSRIINITSIKKMSEKIINNTSIIGVAANPSAIRGNTAIAIIFDEAAWAIRFKNQARETWKALKYFIRQGGQARIQSTPRTSNTEEFFWGMYSKGESGNLAIHQYECPVITNWKELDLTEPLYIELNNERRVMRGMRKFEDKEVTNFLELYKNNPVFEITKNHIKQKAVIPYWWVNIEDLETDRAEDVEQFKQENLCVPLDETFKLLKSEWIYGNLNEEAEWNDRGKSENRFIMLMDFASKRDLTAITIVEEILNPESSDKSPVYIERKIDELSGDYALQREVMFDYILAFRPTFVSGDNTGFNPKMLKRVNFSMQSKEQMAQGFRNMVMPDTLTEKSHYRWLYKKKKHQNSIRHCLRVERELLPQGGVRYSGKMHGRDDHFWSKAQLALLRNIGVVKAAFGRFNKRVLIGEKTKGKSFAEKFLMEQEKKGFINYEDIKMKEDMKNFYKDSLEKNKNLKFAIKCLMHGRVICRTSRMPVMPIHCAKSENCMDEACDGYKTVKDICKRYKVTKEEVFNGQEYYK